MSSNNIENRSRLPSTSNDTEIAIVLGRRRNNPYTLNNMLAAINKIYNTSYTTLAATHKYVKFLPTTQEHLAILEDWETEKLTPLFSYPLDYEIDVPGDYYYDPAVTDSMYTYKYASVEVGTTLPNVPYQVIDDIFIPPYNSYVTEQAFYQVGEPYDGDTSPHPNGTGDGDGDDPNDNCTPGCANYPCCKVGWVDCGSTACTNNPIGPIPCSPGDPDWPACLELFPPDNPPNPNNPGGQEQRYCECTEYTQGNQGNTWVVWIGEGEDCSDYEIFSGNYWVECSTHTPPPPPPTVFNECNCPVPNNRRYPAGCIKVDEDGSDAAVKQVMVVLKDTWFTSDIVYTDNNGCWQHNEAYYNNVWVTVKFKNNNCKIRAMRRARVLEAVGVADDYVDRFEAPPYNNIYVYYADDLIENESRARRYWACAHTMNGDIEYRIAVVADGVPLPKAGLNYALFASDNSTAGAPMLQWRPFGAWPLLAASFIYFPYVAAAIVLTSPLYPDIINNYGPGESAEGFKGSQSHELGHASHYSLVGEDYWFPYRNHIVNNSILDSDYIYGQFGNFAFLGSDPGRVALGEAIGNFAGNRYGLTQAGGEGIAFNLPWDSFPENFIPRGLMFDLMDSDVDYIEDPNNPAINGYDNISGFTPAQIFGALTPDINSIRAFRNRLSTLSLSSTPNTLSSYNTFVDIYDVFN